MATDIERVYCEVLGRMPLDDRHYGFLSRQLAELQAQILIDFLDFDKFPNTEAEVREELARQANEYIKFGLYEHPEVDMAKGQFKDKLVALAVPQPERFTGRFDIPIAVLGQVPPKDLYKAEGVDYYLEGLGVGDWPDDPLGYKTPQGLYLTWMDTGVRNLNKKVEDVRSNLPFDARGATEFDGSGLYVAHPRILTHHSPDLPGTSVESDGAPDLALFRGRPEVLYGWVGVAHPKCGSALCGRD